MNKKDSIGYDDGAKYSWIQPVGPIYPGKGKMREIGAAAHLGHGNFIEGKGK
jgi:hypothetical protein